MKPQVDVNKQVWYALPNHDYSDESLTSLFIQPVKLSLAHKKLRNYKEKHTQLYTCTCTYHKKKMKLIHAGKRK